MTSETKEESVSHELMAVRCWTVKVEPSKSGFKPSMTPEPMASEAPQRTIGIGDDEAILDKWRACVTGIVLGFRYARVTSIESFHAKMR